MLKEKDNVKIRLDNTKIIKGEIIEICKSYNTYYLIETYHNMQNGCMDCERGIILDNNQNFVIREIKMYEFYSDYLYFILNVMITHKTEKLNRFQLLDFE